MSSNQKVLIKSLSKTVHSKILTSDGIKKFNVNNEIEVSLELALSLVDEKNWSCKEDLQKLSKKFGLDKKRNIMQDLEEDEVVENEEDETEDETNEEDENSDMGDEDIKDLIRKIPSMKFKDLKEAAEQAGIDTEEYTQAEKKALGRLLIKTLKGK